MQVFDITDLDEPTEVAQIPSGRRGDPLFRSPFDFDFIDGFLLIAERLVGIGIIDIRDPSSPARVGTLAMPGRYANSITIRDRKAFVGNEDAGLVILDVDDPMHPTILSQTSGRGKANGLHLHGDHVYVAHWERGVSIFDISDHSSVTEIGWSPNDGFAFDALAVPPFIYIVDKEEGLRVVDIQSLENPQLVYESRGQYWDLHLVGQHLYAADKRLGMVLFESGIAGQPRLIGVLRKWGGIRGVHVHGNTLLVAGESFGIAKISRPAAAPVITLQPRSQRVRPNEPFFLEVAAAGTEPFTYRWYHDGVEVDEAIDAVQRISKATPKNEGEYVVEVRNALGMVRSVSATVDLDLRQPLILTDSFQVNSMGVRFTVLLQPGAPFAVMFSDNLKQWQELQVISAVDRAVEVFDEVRLKNQRYYRLENRP